MFKWLKSADDNSGTSIAAENSRLNLNIEYSMKYLPFFLLVSLSCVVPRDSGPIAIGQDKNNALKIILNEPVALQLSTFLHALSTDVDVDDHVVNTIMGRAIKVILDTTPFCPAKNEKIVVVVSPPHGMGRANVKPTNLMAWFKYNCDDEHVVVNYYSFPDQEKLSDVGMDVAEEDSAWRYSVGWQVFDSLLWKIIKHGRLTNLPYVKTLKIPLPQTLKTEELIHKMRKIDRTFLVKYPDDDSVVGYPLGPAGYVWGIKTDDMEAIRDAINYEGATHYEIERTWDSIVIAILKHETPANWNGR